MINNFLQYYKENQFVIFLIFLLTILAIFPLFSTGFTTKDDMQLYLHHVQIGVSYNSLLSYIQTIGFRPFAYIFFSVPYIFDSFFWFKLTQIVALILSLGSLSYLIYIITKNKNVALLSYSLLIGFIQTSWGHNILTSYPFAFHFSLSLIFISLILFYNYLNSNKQIYLYFSITLYFVSLLSYETHCFYSILFVLLTLLHTDNLKSLIKKPFIVSFLYPLLATIFIIFYFSLKVSIGNNYAGTTLDLSNLSATISVLWQYSISSIPSYIYSNTNLPYITLGRDFFYHTEIGLLNVLKSVTIENYVLSFLISVLTFKLIQEYSTKLKVFLILGSTSIIFVFLPNLPLALTSKYQEWVANGDLTYTMTFYSFIAFIVFIISIIGIVYHYLQNSYQKKIFAFSISTLFFLVSLFNTYGNQIIFKTQELSHNKWKAIDNFLDTTYFKQLPKNSILFAPSLTKAYSIAATDKKYWQNYIQYKTKQKVIVEDKIQNLVKYKNKPIFYLRFNQNYDSKMQYITLSSIKNIQQNTFKQLEIWTDTVYMLTNDNFGKVNLICQQKKATQVQINNKPILQPTNINQSLIFLEDNKNNIKVIMINGNNIIANNCQINSYTYSEL